MILVDYIGIFLHVAILLATHCISQREQVISDQMVMTCVL